MQTKKIKPSDETEANHVYPTTASGAAKTHPLYIQLSTRTEQNEKSEFLCISDLAQKLNISSSIPINLTFLVSYET